MGPVIKTTHKALWLARGGGIARTGPFDSQADAAKAIRYAEPVNGQLFPPDSFVWSEVSAEPQEGK